MKITNLQIYPPPPAYTTGINASLENDAPVHIKISLSQIDKKVLEDFLFETDIERHHFQSSQKIPNTTESKVTIFKFEDFNTKGIKGKLLDKQSPMHAFLLKDGITSQEKREGTSGGSRGIGKTSFIYTSEYHTFFLSTLSEDGEMHIGRAYLEPERKIHNTYYDRDAYFVQNNEEPHPHAISDKKLENFKHIFNFDRTENGTSIIILSPKYDELKDDRQFINYTITNIVEKYYFLFIENKLSVSVTDSQGNCKIIDQNNIYECMERSDQAPIDDKEPEKPFSPAYVSFIKNMYTQDIATITFDDPQDDFKNFEISESESTRLKNLYHSEDIFKAIFTYWVENCKEQVTFYIQKSDEKVTETHLRRHILHVGKSAWDMRSKTKQKMFIGVNILPEPPTEKTQQILKGCEDESHQKWIHQNDREKDKIRLAITKHIPEFLHATLQAPKSQKRETFHVFDDVFPMKPKTGNSTNNTVNTNGGDTTEKFTHPNAKAQDFTISPLNKANNKDCGFSVTAGEGQTQVPKNLIIRVGYWQERKGKEQCIKAYTPFDFNVADMNARSSGATISRQQDNIIHLKNVQTDFKFTITGFNRLFDLVIDVKGADDEKNA